MGRTTVYTQETDNRAKQSPIWRGIGCLMIIIIPVISYIAAVLTMPFLLQRGLVPRELLFTPELPPWIWYVPVVARALQFLFVRYAIAATLLLTIFFIMIIGTVFSIFYALMYRVAGPPKYGPLDAPPPKKKIKKYTR